MTDLRVKGTLTDLFIGFFLQLGPESRHRSTSNLSGFAIWKSKADARTFFR